MQDFIQPGDVVLADIGTSSAGTAGLRMPSGVAIERLILGPGSSYNDINQWRYAEAASFFDTQDQAIAYRVRTEDELEDALVAARDGEALVLIELVMSRLDAPGPLVNFAQRCAEFNFPRRAALLGRGP
jgi:TPP-dependent 2-oxoacid decarboxylase